MVNLNFYNNEIYRGRKFAFTSLFLLPLIFKNRATISLGFKYKYSRNINCKLLSFNIINKNKISY